MPALERVYPAAVMDATGLRPAPFQFYLTGAEHLRIVSISTVQGPTVRIHGRFWREQDRAIGAFAFEHLPLGVLVQNRQDYALTAGALLNLCVFIDEGLPAGTQTFVRVQIIRGLTGATTILGTLLQGYLRVGQDLAWPGTPIGRLDDGPGELVVPTWTPIAGNPLIDLVVPTNEEWRIDAATALFTASAVAGVRTLVVAIVRSGGVAAFSADDPLVTGAGTSVQVSIGAGLQASPASPLAQHVLPFPTFARIVAGDLLRFFIGGAQVGDLIAGGQVLIRSWFRL